MLSLVLILNIDTLIAAVVISSSLPPHFQSQGVGRAHWDRLFGLIYNASPAPGLDVWQMTYFCTDPHRALTWGSTLGISLLCGCCWQFHRCESPPCLYGWSWRRWLRTYGNIHLRCEGVVIPTRGCVYFSLFICAPETTGRWNSPTSASALGDLVEIVVCASSLWLCRL